MTHRGQEFSLCLSGSDGLIARFRQLPVLPLKVLRRFGQGMFGPFPEGNVDDGGERKLSIGRIDWIEAELDGKLGAIFA